MVSIFLVLAMAQNVSAAVDWVDISIDHAYYYDLDADGTMDDVRVDITCTVRGALRSYAKTEYYIALAVPSGLTYLVILTVIGRYSVLHMTLYWYDCAQEAGWYNVRVDGFSFAGPELGHSTASCDFDPPTKGGSGQPHVELLIW